MIPKVKFDEASEQVSTLESQILTSDTEKHLNDKKVAITNDIKANKAKLIEINVFLFIFFFHLHDLIFCRL